MVREESDGAADDNIVETEEKAAEDGNYCRDKKMPPETYYMPGESSNLDGRASLRSRPRRIYHVLSVALHSSAHHLALQEIQEFVIELVVVEILELGSGPPGVDNPELPTQVP